MMANEWILIAMLFATYSLVILWYRLFGVKGLISFSVLATIAANIEVLIVVKAFGIEQTLGNVLFASTFLITDILSETEGKKVSQTAVNIGILASATFVLFSQSWLLYTPSDTDMVFPAIKAVFSQTPRVMLASFLVYAVSQKFDVWAYHRWWEFSSKRFGDARRFLWLRNNGSTLISQLVNTVLFTLGAFGGVYDAGTLLSIGVSSYIIYAVASLLDTPFVYWARRIHEKRNKA